VQLHDYNSPAIVESKNKDWIEYGDDNSFYEYLISLYHSSPTNNAAVKGISDLIFGGGLEVVKADRQLDGYLSFKKLFRDDCVRKLCMDFKMLGQASFQVIKSKDGKRFVQAEHFPIYTLRPEKANDKGEVEAYYYHHNWAEATPSDTPTRIPAFGYEGNAMVAMYVIKPYSTGNDYFNPVDYQGGLQYAEMESEIANYHLNNIKNSLLPTMMVNFNNGIPDERKQQQIESKLKQKFSGSSNAGRFILAFNDDKDSQASIEPIQLSDAHNQYSFLSNECMSKIMVSHRVTSPMLLGIKDQTGLGNNADELRTASVLFDNTVIRPMQNAIIEAVKDVLHYNGYSLDLYFKTLQPLEFVDLSGKMLDDETREKETGVELSEQGDAKNKALQDMTDEDESHWLEHLSEIGEQMDLEEWELMDEEEVDPDTEDEKYNFFKRFANPQAKSDDDAGIYKIRYRYAPLKASDNSRTFCKNMVQNGERGVVYRREDIENMAGKVNTEWSPKGTSTYSIWRFKGGAYCKHYWVRQVFVRARDGKGRIKPASSTKDLENDKRIAESGARRAGVPNTKFEPKKWKEAQQRPTDMPDQAKLN